MVGPRLQIMFTANCKRRSHGGVVEPIRIFPNGVIHAQVSRRLPKRRIVSSISLPKLRSRHGDDQHLRAVQSDRLRKV
jgi:hypothetical protein